MQALAASALGRLDRQRPLRERDNPRAVRVLRSPPTADRLVIPRRAGAEHRWSPHRRCESAPQLSRAARLVAADREAPQPVRWTLRLRSCSAAVVGWAALRAAQARREDLARARRARSAGPRDHRSLPPASLL